MRGFTTRASPSWELGLLKKAKDLLPSKHAEGDAASPLSAFADEKGIKLDLRSLQFSVLATTPQIAH